MLLAALIGGAVGLVVGWLVAHVAGARERARLAGDLAAARAECSTRLDEATRRTAWLEQQLAQRGQANEDLQRQVADLREQQGQLGAQIEGERRLAAEKLALLSEAEAKLREAFATLSADALRANSQSFIEIAKNSLAEQQRVATSELLAREQAMSNLVQPLNESLQKVGEKLQQVEKERVAAYSALAEQIRSVAAGQQGLQTETARLVRALREPKARGRWGEIQLRRVVEMAGMLDRVDFCEQASLGDEQSRLIPDLVVHLPGDRRVVVDAKVPLTAYLAAVEAEDEATREASLKDHARQVREHMRKLAAKAYWEQVQPAPEFVIMFLPGEPFFSAALLYDPGLIDWGVDQRVILASPITLIALLRAVSYGWRQEQIAENAQAISDLGREMYDRVRVVAEHIERVGGALGKAVESYNQAVGSIESRLLATARRLEQLGAGSTKDLPALEPIDRLPRAAPEDEVGSGLV
jgi:DNA recombination protein RmuC